MVIEPLCSLGVGEEGVARSGLGRALEWRLFRGYVFKRLSVSTLRWAFLKADSMGGGETPMLGYAVSTVND